MAYIIARVYNSHGPSDYIHSIDTKAKTTLCMGKPCAKRFARKSNAVKAAKLAKQFVPNLVGGFPINYVVLEADGLFGGK